MADDPSGAGPGLVPIISPIASARSRIPVVTAAERPAVVIEHSREERVALWTLRILVAWGVIGAPQPPGSSQLPRPGHAPESRGPS